MNHLQIHLWREWREHRRSLYFLAGSLTLVVLGLSQQLAENVLRDPVFLWWTSALMVATVVFSVASDLFARERQAGTDEFLRRLPGGLSDAFTAKLLFFWLLVVGAALFGGALGVMGSLSRTGSVPEMLFAYLDPEVLVAGLIGLAWVFPVSTWVKSGALAVPATLLFLVAVFFPPVWAVTQLGYHVTNAFLWTHSGLAICGSLASAWVGFVRAGKLNHSRKRATFSGLGVAILFLAPAWAWAINGYFVLQQTQLKYSHVVLGEGQRHAFVTLVRESIFAAPGTEQFSRQPTALLLDLETGDWELKGVVGESTWSSAYDLRGVDSMVRPERGASVVELFSASEGGIGRTYYEGRSGESLVDQDPNHVRRLILASQRDWPSAFDRDGGKRSIGHAGAGYVCILRVDGKTRRVYWDPVTGRTSDLSAARDPDGRRLSSRVQVGPGRWLVKPHAGPWIWFDPDTNLTNVASCIEARDFVGNSFDDGSVFLTRGTQFYRLDTATEQLHELTVRGSLQAGTQINYFSARGMAPLSSSVRSVLECRTLPSGNPLVQYEGVAVLDPSENTIDVVDLAGYGVLVAGDGFALVCEELQRHQGRLAALEHPGRLLRLDLETLETRVVLDLAETGLFD